MRGAGRRVPPQVRPRRRLQLVLLVTRSEGRPLIQPYNIFSYVSLRWPSPKRAIATGNDEYARIALETFDNAFWKRAAIRKGVGTRGVAGHPPPAEGLRPCR